MNSTTHYFRVAGFLFAISLPEVDDIDGVLPSFAPFRCEPPREGRVLFSVCSSAQATVDLSSARLLENAPTDICTMLLYAMPTGYAIEAHSATGMTHLLTVDPRFSTAAVTAQWADPLAGAILAAMIRVVFSQAVLPHGAISLHAAAVAVGRRAYLFMGRSGTGKSTHAQLWLRADSECELLNDDNPTVRVEDGHVVAYGTPWSGKTPCYKNKSYSVGGIVRLSQAPFNRFTAKCDVEAFVTIMPGCAVFPLNAHLRDCMCDTLSDISAMVRVGTLDCLPNAEAAKKCMENIRTDAINPTNLRYNDVASL